jgi:hypothetical protein
MSTLRVLLDAAPTAALAGAWTLFDDAGRIAQSGCGVPDTWPAAPRREAVLAASCVRIVALHLPPLTADRVSAAAAFALEDQLAGPANEQHIAVSSQRADGTVEAIVANRGLVERLTDEFDRILAEPALAPLPRPQHWRWYASEAGAGFVRKPDGSSFATSALDGVPAELALALDHAARAGSGPVAVELAFAPGPTLQADLARHTGTSFVTTPPWRWETSGNAAFAAATDVRQGEFARAAPATTHVSARWFRWAAILAALAIGLHITATIGEWISLRVDSWRVRSALSDVARNAGITGSEDPAAAIAKRYAEARHRAGLAASADALPLLSRAAPALALLPTGTLKSATYAEGHWTFDLSRLDVGAAARLERQLADAGLSTLAATSPSGARMRVAPGPGAQ